MNGLNLQVEQGEIFRFLGPNGSGKSTTFKILVGLLEPDQGTVLIDGHQIVHRGREIYGTVGYMPDMIDLYDLFTVEELLRFFGLCYNMTADEIEQKCDNLLEIFD